jgi:hypothetical protein
MREENKVEQILSSVLDGAAEVVQEGGQGSDLLLEMRDGTRVAIEVKWAGEGWPQDVRQALNTWSAASGENAIVVARRLSPGSIKWLREHDANWADESGQARIIGPSGLLVIREPKATRRPPEGAFAWSESAGAIAETLIGEPDGPILTETLADHTGWSKSRTASVLKSFDIQGWTVKRGSNRGPRAFRELHDWNHMLESWSRWLIEAPQHARYAHRAGARPLELLTDVLAPALDGQVNWAVSGWAGLELAAPYATTVPSLQVYIASDDFAARLSKALESSGLQETEETGIVTFLRTHPRTLRLGERYRGIPVVSTPRLYADLDGLSGRGHDAAAYVKQELIEPLHTRGKHLAAADG